MFRTHPSCPSSSSFPSWSFPWLWCILVAASLVVSVAAEPPPPAVAALPEAATAGTCQPSATNLCLHDGRFSVRVSFTDSQGGTGNARKVQSQSEDSGLFWFYRQSNWEMLVKVLDGCGVNGHFWVFAAATTDVGYRLRVQDTVTGQQRVYRNPVGRSAPAITDSEALAVCDPAATRAGQVAPAWRPEPGSFRAPTSFAIYRSAEVCVSDQDTLCLNQGRFRVRVEWQDFADGTGDGRVVPLSSDDSGLFWFFNPANWEMLVKALDGCAVNGHHWVFAAATTNVGYSLHVTDSATGASRSYVNPPGRSAAPVLDTSAFSCAGADGLPPDPGPANDQTLAGIDSDGDGLRDDVQRFIALNYGADEVVAAGLRQSARAQLGAVVGEAAGPIQAAGDLVRAAECLRVLEPSAGDLERTLLAEVLDTEERLRAYLQLNDALGGEAFSSRPPEEWAASCGFDPADPSQVRASSVIRVPASACVTTDTAVYFANGMLNTFQDARDSLLTLRLALGQQLPGNTGFALAFNPSGGPIADLWEAVRQDLASDSSRFFRILSGLSLMPQFFQDALLGVAAGIDRGAVAANADATAHLNLYRSEVLEGKKVIVVAHSQGNFFANLVHGALDADERRSVGIVSVGTPDSFVAGGGPYVTLDEDHVIDHLVRAVPFVNPLPANLTNGQTLGDPLGHNFVLAYMLHDTPSRTAILGHIEDVHGSLEEPVGVADDGIITITLTWGDEPDVDLHVYEPNGTHVYYARQQGLSGFLDVDDTTSFGPEHYFVACDDLETGTYRVGLNYYFGFGPETAQVQVRAGLDIQTFRQVLTSSRGSSGDQSPLPVAEVRVSGSSEDGFQFFVSSAQ